MEKYKGWYLKSPSGETKIEIEENGLKYIVDIEEGQKKNRIFP